MEPYIFNESFETVATIDEYESFIWTDRYASYGDFEIYAYPSSKILTYGVRNNYVYLPESDHLMIIESVSTTTDVDTGDRIILAGRSLESILDRRIVWSQTTVSGNVDACIYKLINQNIISPSLSYRRINNFSYNHTSDSYITGTTMKAQYTGDNIYDIVTEICNEIGIGFKVTLNASNQFVFELYNGKDRSYAQNANPWVVFSPEYENIINSSYIYSSYDWKNAALIAGEDQGTSRKTSEIGSSRTNLIRREMFVDARDIRSTDENGDPISAADYNTMLQKRGKEQMTEYQKHKGFEGDVETLHGFVFGEDYFLGDIVQVEDAYGYGDAMRVTEVVRSQDKNGINVIPTFTALEEED